MSKPFDSRGFYLNPCKIESMADMAVKIVKTLMAHRFELSRVEMETILEMATDIVNIGETLNDEALEQIAKGDNA